MFVTRNQLLKKEKIFFLLCFAAYAVSYIGRYNYSTCMQDMITEGLFDEGHGGYVSTAFLTLYALGQFFNGILADRLDPRKMMAAGLVMSGIANICMSFASSFGLCVVFWGVNGYSCALLWAPIIKCFTTYLDPEQRAKACINIAPSIPLGTLLSYGLSALGLALLPSWRQVFLFCGLVILSYGVIFFLGTLSLGSYYDEISELAKTVPETEDGRVKEHPLARVSFPVLLFVTGVVFAVVATLSYGILKDAVAQWIPKYLSNTFGLSASAASTITIVLPIVNLCGAYTANFIYKRFTRNELLTAMVMFLISSAALLTLRLAGKSSVVVAILAFSVSSSSMLGVNTMLFSFLPMHFSDIGKAATVTGFLDATSYFASAVLAAVSGAVISAPHGGWNAVILLWLGISLFGAVISLVGTSFWNKGKKKLSA